MGFSVNDSYAFCYYDTRHLPGYPNLFLAPHIFDWPTTQCHAIRLGWYQCAIIQRICTRALVAAAQDLL